MAKSPAKTIPIFTFLFLSLFISSFVSFVPSYARAGLYEKGQMALIQYNGDLHFGDYQTNMKNLTRLATEAVRNKANIIVFPEGSSWGYASAEELWCRHEGTYGGKSCRDIATIAEEIPRGKTTSYWEEFAKRNNVTIIFHIPEREQDSFYNSIGVVGPTGYITKYRKRMLYWVDKAYAQPGREPVVLNTDYGKFGLMICMDALKDGLYYDEYKRLGSSAIVLSTDWDQDVNSPTNAKDFFFARAQKNGIDIFASDVSPWDGTGLYPAIGEGRIRNGLPDVAVGEEGISFHQLNY